MATAKEKAKELVEKFIEPTKIPNIKGMWVEDFDVAKQCALISVDEIIEATVKYVAIRERVDYSKTGFDNVVRNVYDKYWKEVKNEIEKL